MRYRVERDVPFRDESGNYHYVIYRGDQFVARYWHDFRGDEQCIIFANGLEDFNGLPGRCSEFIGGDGESLELTAWAVDYIEKRCPQEPAGCKSNIGGTMGNLGYVAPVFRVADLARSLAYYRDRLGFDVAFNYEGSYAGVIRDGCHVHLKQSEPIARDQAAFEAAEHLDACFEVRDAQSLAASFVVSGATLSMPLRQQPYGDEFYVRDPDGYVLGFVQPAERRDS